MFQASQTMSKVLTKSLTKQEQTPNIATKAESTVGIQVQVPLADRCHPNLSLIKCFLSPLILTAITGAANLIGE